MTLKQIEYFRKVCEKGNISSAAEELFISRSVVSRAILELEDEFGDSLFIRSKNGVVLTESGHILSRLFEAIMASYETAKERIELLSQNSRMRPLRLGVTPTNAYCVYYTYLAGFKVRYPDVRLYIEEHSAYEAWKMLLDGEMDAFFTPGTPDTSVFETLDLYRNPAMLGIREGDTTIASKASMADLADLPLAFFSAKMPLEGLLEAGLGAIGKRPNIVLRTSDQMLLYKLTLEGEVYPILPLDMMATWEGIRQVPLDFHSAGMNRLVWSRALEPEETLNQFLSYMKEQIK